MTSICGRVQGLSIFPIALLLVAALAAPAAAARCTTRFDFIGNEVQTVRGVTKKNTPCTFGYRMTDMVSVTPIVRPRHGRLLKKSLGSFAYQPNANFVGQDSFTIQVIWGINESNKIRYDIEIVP